MNIYHTTKANGKTPKVPLSRPTWRIALVANLQDDFERGLDDPPDAGAEFDRRETLEAIAAALETEGHWVHFCAADHTLPEALIGLRPQMVFNIAEGLSGDGREAQVPALCELMGIPYTTSGVVAHALSLDKAQTKRIWQHFGLPSAPFQEISSLKDVSRVDLNYPLFIKPVREGTGMGVDGGAIVHEASDLEARLAWVLQTYRQPALVEEYLPGREFTVGFIGNAGNPTGRRRPELYAEDGYHWFPVLEIDTQPSLSPRVYGHDAKALDIGAPGAPGYLCPAEIPDAMRVELTQLTKRAAQAIGVRDVSRVDFRMGADDQPYLMEINTLPGLNPSVSDLCIMASAEGMLYQDLILEILHLAAERSGFHPSASNSQRELLSKSWREVLKVRV